MTTDSATEISFRETGDSSRLRVADSMDAWRAADLVILAVGAWPDSALAQEAGAQLGVAGAVVVTRQMRTNLTDVFAAGDCVETYRRLIDKPPYISLGTVAHKQGCVAGENAVGGNREFSGALAAQSIKVFDLAIARTGLLEHEARDAELNPATVQITANDHKAYYPGATFGPLGAAFSAW